MSRRNRNLVLHNATTDFGVAPGETFVTRMTGFQYADPEAGLPLPSFCVWYDHCHRNFFVNQSAWKRLYGDVLLRLRRLPAEGSYELVSASRGDHVVYSRGKWDVGARTKVSRRHPDIGVDGMVRGILSGGPMKVIRTTNPPRAYIMADYDGEGGKAAAKTLTVVFGVPKKHVDVWLANRPRIK